MKLLKRIKSLTAYPGMPTAYVRWVCNRILLRRNPAVRVGQTAALRAWAGFTEYWTFLKGVPVAERVLMTKVLAESTTKVAFDIGANVGVFTCLLPELGARQVHAFEPVPETFCRMKANVEANGILEACRLNCLAVGSENDLVTFRVEAKAAATNRLFVAGALMPASASLQTVAAVRLDDYCQKLGVDRIDFMKIDVEGMEALVLDGARKMFREKRVGLVMIEICPVNLRSVGLSPELLFNAITRTGYSAYTLLDDGCLGPLMTLADIEVTLLANAVLIPE